MSYCNWCKEGEEMELNLALLAESLGQAFEGIGAKLILFTIFIMAVYLVSFVIFRAIRIPKGIARPLSSLVTLGVMYYSYISIFTT